MSKFITGKDLEAAICNIIWDAERILLIVSPYIKLDDYFKKLFHKHTKNPKLHIILVFGKNENEIQRSLNKGDFDFFKEFPNISIIYVPNLHAKYYGNEQKGVVTSINLYDHSFKNNIEFGVYTEHTMLTKIGSAITGNQFDSDAWKTCLDIADKNNAIFIRRPIYEKKLLILSNYIDSETLHDSTKELYSGIKNLKLKHLDDFPDELELEVSTKKRPQRESKENNLKNPEYGYCIRTGEQIKFDPKRPFTYSAWQSWNEYKNQDFKEKYCHKTGKPSYGKTSMRNPILEN